MGTLGFTSLLPLLVLVLLPGPLTAFPSHLHDVSTGHEDSGHGNAGHSHENTHEGEDTDHGHGGYSYKPPAKSYLPPETENGWVGEYENKWAVKDDAAGLDFGQNEVAKNNEVVGTYWVLLPDGRKETVTYRAEKDAGYTAEVSYEEGTVPLHQSYGTSSPPSNLYETPAPPPTHETPAPPPTHETPAPPSNLYETPAPPPTHETPAPPHSYHYEPPVSPPNLYQTPAPSSTLYKAPESHHDTANTNHPSPVHPSSPHESSGPVLDLRSSFVH